MHQLRTFARRHKRALIGAGVLGGGTAAALVTRKAWLGRKAVKGFRGTMYASRRRPQKPTHFGARSTKAQKAQDRAYDIRIGNLTNTNALKARLTNTAALHDAMRARNVPVVKVPRRKVKKRREPPDIRRPSL